MAPLLSLALGLGVGSTTGCVEGAYVSPSLAYVGPGVYAVVDYDIPVFYSDNYYWLYSGSIWYRSSYYNRGWVRYPRVPVAIRQIRQPYRYRHYRPRGRVYRQNEIPRARRDYDQRARRDGDRRARPTPRR